ncbi:MAG: GGDEF domain-containing protein [Desulfovibrionaceae bacterium]
MPEANNLDMLRQDAGVDEVEPESEAVLEELAQELLSIQERFRLGAKPASSGGRALALLRLCPGLTQEQWTEFSERLGLEHWISISLGANTYPQARRLQQMLEKLSYDSDHDPLTGLANRRAFDRALDMELERSRRHNSPLALAILDLDNFKSVNDTYGHAMGDKVLERLAQVMNDHKRRYDTAGRLGGEEFALLLPEVGSIKAEKILNRLIRSFREQTFTPEGRAPFSVTASVGVASCLGRLEIAPQAMVELADQALYRAKSMGKNRVVAAPIPDMERVSDKTLVHAEEKRFLFSA